MSDAPADGVYVLPPRDAMCDSARKLRDTYARTPGAPFYHRTFGLWMCLDHWKTRGLPEDVDIDAFFHFDSPEGKLHLGHAGWTTAAFCPAFEEKVIEDRGDHEVVQDTAGRAKLVFKGRRMGFMPDYLDHPVKDRLTWEENVKWRLDAATPERWTDFDQRIAEARKAAACGRMISANVIGGYMYLRSLVGPEGVLYAFYDMPEVLHDCMQTWLEHIDGILARYQEHLTLDEVFLAEDICYNHGPLISPDLMREFLFPYYRQLIANVKARQIDRSRHLYVQIDTDGFSDPIVELYRDAIGMEMLSPFEVASGCDVVEAGRRWPELTISGGIDKRVLAKSTDDIDRMLEGILPVMRERGGYIPTCDHGVPPEVPWQNYLHYRTRCIEYGN